jgi:hypothetical protein
MNLHVVDLERVNNQIQANKKRALPIEDRKKEKGNKKDR